MMKFSLELLYTILNIGAASGLILRNDSLYLISDNGGYLYEYNIKTQALETILIFDIGVTANIPKPLKADFEAMAHYGDIAYVFGSGSTEKRKLAVIVDLNSKEIISSKDISELYTSMILESDIPQTEFNIEGVVYDGQTWYFFQRGNGPSGINGVFTVSGNIFGNDYSLTWKRIDLPLVRGVRASFTDAVLTKNGIWFLAAAEDSNSVYHDGEILGSFIGRIGIKTLVTEHIIQISKTQKFEGLTILDEKKDKMVFLLCEDNDGEASSSGIFKLAVDIKN